VSLSRLAWIALLVVAAPVRAAFEPVVPDSLDGGRPRPAIVIGAAESARPYYRLDRGGCPLTLEGPGTLRVFVRADVPSGSDAPDSAWIALDGLIGFAQQRWALALSAPLSSAYPGGARRGRPTSAERITLIVPAGRNRLLVSGTSDIGEAVYAAFTFERIVLPPPEPVVAAPAPAETPRRAPAKASPRKPVWALSSDLGVAFIYDDNILRLSDTQIDQFRRNENPPQWAITTYDDMILDATLEGAVARTLLFGKATALRLRYERWQYARNDIKTNEEFEVRARQTVRRADYLEASYLYAPPGYIKELSDRPPFLPLAVPRVYDHFLITKNQFTLTYRWRANPWLALRLIGGRVLRFYNQPFLENDLWEWNARVAGDATWGRFTTTAHYAYASDKARGVDETGETIPTGDNGSDGSYAKDWYRLQLAYRPKAAPYRPAAPSVPQRIAALADAGLVRARTASLTLAFDYQRQFYTSQLPLAIDALHVGRLDQVRQIQLVWTSLPVWRKVTLEAGWRYTKRTAKGPGSLIGEDPSEEKDYTGSRYWLAFATPLY
jgi:hypothetical protein